MVAAALRETGIDPEQLHLELTETSIMAAGEEAMGMLERLRELGIRLSLDDFGTGYSSLKYARDLPIDALKIDRSFVQDIAVADSDEAIVSAVLAMGHLGPARHRRGAQSCHQLDFLRQRGCEMGQGYLFSRPVAADKIPALARRSLIAEDERVLALLPPWDGHSQRRVERS